MNRAERRAMDRANRRLHHSSMYIKARRRHGRFYNASDLDCTQVRDLQLVGHAALTAITRGQGLEVDIDNLALISNVALVLAEMGLGADLLPEVMAGQDAVMALQARFARLGRVGAGGDELRALNGLLELHDAQLDIPPTVEEMRKAIAEVRRRRESGHVMDGKKGGM